MLTGTLAPDLAHIRFSGRRASAASADRATLRRVTTHQAASRAADADAVLKLDGLPATVLAAAGIATAAYRAAPFERRTPACLRALRASGIEAARARLTEHPASLDAALDAFLIGVSSFFRDAAVFDAIASQVLPALAATQPRLRICSLGCSTGEELYSTAMLLTAAGLLERCELVGVDCRPRAIAAARRGRYLAASAALAPSWCADFFEVCGDEVEVASRIRERVSWQLADITTGLPPGPWHLVLCRNVAIYLTSAASGRLLAEIAAHLVPGGVLAVGKAERPPAAAPLTLMARCLYRRHG